MNIGTIINRGLNRAGLSVNDLSFRNLALDFLNEIIQEHWQAKNWKFRIKPLTITTANGTEEYALDKRVPSVSEIVPNSFQGSNPYRNIRYSPITEFKRTHNAPPQSGDSYQFRESQIKKFQNNPSSASVLAFVSSLSNYTTGTVTVVNGSTQIIFSGSTITLDKLGLWIRIGSDTRAYKLARKDGTSSTVFYLDEAYEGEDASGASFVLGDINQTVTVLGYVSGVLTEEEVQLNGATPVSTSNQFTSLVQISKSDRTGGYITGTSNSGGVTNIVLDPGETECDFVNINLYPIPTKTETLNFDSYIRHPLLSKYSDSPLFPNQFHELLAIDLYIRLETEWNKNQVSELTISRRDKILQDMVDIDNSVDNWTIYQESEENSERSKINNLPVSYGVQDDM